MLFFSRIRNLHYYFIKNKLYIMQKYIGFSSVSKNAEISKLLPAFFIVVSVINE